MDIPVILLLVFLAREDFTARMTSAWVYPVLALLWGCRSAMIHGGSFFTTDFPFNVMLVLLFIGIIRLYGHFSRKRVSDLIGKGDLWFMGALAMVFLLPDLLLFINVSLGMALLWWAITRSKRGVPLVGIQATCYIIFIVLSWSRYLYT
jgi:predicted membrane protein